MENVSGGMGKWLGIVAETPERAEGSEGKLNPTNDRVGTDPAGTLTTNTSMNTKAGNVTSAASGKSVHADALVKSEASIIPNTATHPRK
jgi:hypothetical protein